MHTPKPSEQTLLEPLNSNLNHRSVNIYNIGNCPNRLSPTLYAYIYVYIRPSFPSQLRRDNFKKANNRKIES